MNLILESLYLYAMESGKNRYLDRDELRDYRSAVCAMERLSDQLEHLLEGESLRLFKLYAENCDEERRYDDLSTFRKGLAIGLKLGALSVSER